jgi:hypothetical protein
LCGTTKHLLFALNGHANQRANHKWRPSSYFENSTTFKYFIFSEENMEVLNDVFMCATSA